MVLYVKLDSHEWGVEDFTDEDALSLTGTIYSDRELSTAFDLTGYNLDFRMISQGKITLDDNGEDTEIVTAASGTFRYKPDNGKVVVEANGEVNIRLEKTGTQVSAVGVNGSADLHIKLV